MSSPARRRLCRQRGSPNAQLDHQSPEHTILPEILQRISGVLILVPSTKETRVRPDWAASSPHSVTGIQVGLMIDYKRRNRPTKSQKVQLNTLREM